MRKLGSDFSLPSNLNSVRIKVERQTTVYYREYYIMYILYIVIYRILVRYFSTPMP